MGYFITYSVVLLAHKNKAAFVMAATVTISIACLNAATKLHATMLTSKIVFT